MELMSGLAGIGHLDILETALHLPHLGGLRGVRRRRLFDVEARFEHRRLMIETKVDADEGYRWDAQDDPNVWQTARIAAEAGAEDTCLFVTYGYAEFFTKWFDPGPAAGAQHFQHVRLDDMVNLVGCAAPLLANAAIDDWLAALRLEQAKRRAVPEVLTKYATFRRACLDIGQEVDFDVRRMAVNAPALAFPAFDLLRRAWGASRYAARYGRLALYPVNRRTPNLPDSVLNWWELWADPNSLALGGAVPRGRWKLYFEVNEDFNLHLKCDAEDDATAAAVRDEVARRFQGAVPLPFLVRSRPESHKQGAYAVWEWDLNLPALIAGEEANPAAEALGALFDQAVPLLT
ncbi:MAG: hypothetical protein ACP5NP_09315 [Acetobacteraceae bacterium]